MNIFVKIYSNIFEYPNICPTLVPYEGFFIYLLKLPVLNLINKICVSYNEKVSIASKVKEKFNERRDSFYGR